MLSDQPPDSGQPHALAPGAAIAEVAHEVGFADQAHLQRAFKQMMQPRQATIAPPEDALRHTASKAALPSSNNAISRLNCRTRAGCCK